MAGTTGISSLPIGGKTLHSLLHLNLDQPSFTALCDKYRRLLDLCKGGAAPARRASARWTWIENIRLAEVFLLDEISMCSAWLLETADIIFRILREDSRCFGGLHVVFVGDFRQLPPVYKSDGKQNPRSGMFAFESPLWLEAGIRTCALTRVFRQEDAFFSALLSKLSMHEMLTPEESAALRARSNATLGADAIHIAVAREHVTQYNDMRYNELLSKGGSGAAHGTCNWPSTSCSMATARRISRQPPR